MKRICILLLTVSAILVITPLAVLADGETNYGAEIHVEHRLHLNDQGMGKSFNEFNVKRGWFWVHHTFSDRYEARLTLEAYDPMRNESNNTGWTMRLRHAYLQVNGLVRYVDAQAGMVDNYYIARVEKAWGYRFVDEVSLHKLGYLPEADLGVTLIGKCPGDWGVLVVQVLNGASYTERELNKYKDFAIVADIRPFPKSPDFSGVALLGQAYIGWPNIVDNSGSVSFPKNTEKNRLNGAAIFEYRNWLRAFAEVFQTKDDQNWTNDKSPQYVNEAVGFSLFGRVNIATSDTWLARVRVFSKYEWIDRNRNATDPLLADEGDARYLIAGVSYEPVDGYELAISIRRDTENHVVDNSYINEQESNSLLLGLRALIQ
jgi:hypothetical protein